jgi:hypothetical protein
MSPYWAAIFPPQPPQWGDGLAAQEPNSTSTTQFLKKR